MAAFFSCSASQRAYEHPDLKHGVFFYHVLEGLRGKAKNSNDEVTFNSLVDYVGGNVERDVPKLIGGGAEQQPNQKADLRGRSPVLLALSGKPANAKVELKISLAGRSAKGKLGEGTFQVEFLREGQFRVKASDDNEWYTGSWSQSGERVTMKVGSSTFEGTIKGNRLSGSRHRTKGTLEEVMDSWDLTLE